MSEVKKGLFDQLYAAGKEVIDAISKPHVKRALKRKLESAYDDAGKRQDEANKKLTQQRSDFSNYDVNKVLEARQELQVTEEIRDSIRKEWAELFGTEMKVEDED